MKLLHLFIALLFCTVAISQQPVLHFNGDGYVDLGPDAMNGARTIELWFKLDSIFDESANGSQALIARNTTDCNSCDEIQLALVAAQLDANHTGQLRFGWNNSNGGNAIKVFSDQNSWLANQWYHVAGVIDPVTGMRLYVDGIKQLDTAPNQLDAATNSDTTTRIGSWGTSQINPRYFQGHIENLRISNTARYTSNFTPDCPNDTVDAITQGMWFFNTGTGLIAYDSSGNQFDGAIVNATWALDTFCNPIIDPHHNPNGIETQTTMTSLRIYPNPSSSKVITVDNTQNNSALELFVLDISGKQVKYIGLKRNSSQVDLSDLSPGIYLLKASTSDGNDYRASFILE